MARSPTFDWQRVNPPTHPDLQAGDPPHVEQGARLPDPAPLPPPPPKTWRDEPLPPKMRALPRDDRGYPVFFTVQPRGGMPLDGKVDLRVVNAYNHQRCATERLCNVCGKPLYRTLYFIGSPACVQNRVFSDSPLHEECARYALRVCPYLTQPAFGYHERPEDTARLSHATEAELPLGKPERIVLYCCQQYRPIPGTAGKSLYLVEPARWVEWYRPDGVYIARTRPDRYAQ